MTVLGIIAPKDPNSSFALGNLLKSANLVVGTYSFSAQNAFKDLENVVGTVPTLDIYGDVSSGDKKNIKQKLDIHL